MLNKPMGIGIALALMAVVWLPSAGAEGNVIVQLGIAGAGVDEVVHNEWEAWVGGGNFNSFGEGGGPGGNAVSNCQFLLGVNTFVLNVVAIDSFGLIDDDDTFEGLPLIGRIESLGRGGYSSSPTNGTGPCEQHIGAVRVWLETADGWGEPAPATGALTSAAKSLGGALQNGLPGIGGGSNAIVQLGIAGATVGDVVENEADVHVSGSGNAVANCQILVGFNTLVTNVAVVDQDATIEDSDSVNLTRPINGAEPILQPLSKSESKTYPASVGASTSCKQTVDSIDLHIGGNGPKIPPQS